MDDVLYNNLGRCIKCIYSEPSAYGMLCSICNRNVADDGRCLDFELDIDRYTTSQNES